jgi:hypothetical protein
MPCHLAGRIARCEWLRVRKTEVARAGVVPATGFFEALFMTPAPTMHEATLGLTAESALLNQRH